MSSVRSFSFDTVLLQTTSSRYRCTEKRGHITIVLVPKSMFIRGKVAAWHHLLELWQVSSLVLFSDFLDFPIAMRVIVVQSSLNQRVCATGATNVPEIAQN